MSTICFLIENDAIMKTSTNLKIVVVKNFLFRRSTIDLLINFFLFFFVNSRCSNFFINFKQSSKYNNNFHSLNFDLYFNYLTKY